MRVIVIIAWRMGGTAEHRGDLSRSCGVTVSDVEDQHTCHVQSLYTYPHLYYKHCTGYTVLCMLCLLFLYPQCTHVVEPPPAGDIRGSSASASFLMRCAEAIVCFRYRGARHWVPLETRPLHSAPVHPC